MISVEEVTLAKSLVVEIEDKFEYTPQAQTVVWHLMEILFQLLKMFKGSGNKD